MTALEAQARTELMSSPEGGLEQLASIESLTDPARAAELVQHVLIGNNRVALQAAAEYCINTCSTYAFLFKCTTSLAFSYFTNLKLNTSS